MNGEQKPLDLRQLGMTTTLAEAIYKGEWECAAQAGLMPYGVRQVVVSSGDVIACCHDNSPRSSILAEYIATMTPQIAMRLIRIAEASEHMAENLRIAQGLAKANVTAVTINPGDVLVIRIEASQDPTTHDQFVELSRNLSAYFPEGTPVLLTNDIDISALDEEAMRHAGWVKATPPMSEEQRLDIIKRHLKPRSLITHKRCAGIIEEHRFTGWSGQWICGNPTKDSLLNGTSRFKADDIAPKNITHIGRVPVEALDYLAKQP